MGFDWAVILPAWLEIMRRNPTGSYASVVKKAAQFCLYKRNPTIDVKVGSRAEF